MAKRGARLGHQLSRDAGHLIAAANLGANVAAAYFDIRDIDGLLFMIVWTGAVVGSWKVELSSNYLPKVNDINSGASSPVPGNWVDVTSRLTPAITQPNNNAASSPIMVGLPHTDVVMNAKFGRISFTNSSSTGTGDVWLTGKCVGA